MILKYKIKLLFLFLVFSCGFVSIANAGVINSQDVKNVEIFFSPRSGSFTQGSTFEVPIFINTDANSIDKVDIKINFDKDKLNIVKPSGGRSIIESWSETPKYDNTKGIVSYVGTFPKGIVTESGLIATITFKAINYGSADVLVDPSSQVYLNNGQETRTKIDLGRASYDIYKKVSEGVSIFSVTNPSEGVWYNNNNPVLSWQSENGDNGYSFVLDDKPFTIPDNTVDSYDTTKSYENIGNGLWYFHVKAFKNDSWGNTGNFLLKIDTTPPDKFTPHIDNFSASAILANKTLISFLTNDNFSGIDHYEVGVVDKTQASTESPVFIQAESPFSVPNPTNSTSKVVVRAFDKAGNVREGFVTIAPPFSFWKFFVNNLWLLVLLLIAIILVSYYLIKYDALSRIRNRTSFNVIESDIKSYLKKRKESTERDSAEKEKLLAMEKDLKSVIKNIKQEEKEHKK